MESPHTKEDRLRELASGHAHGLLILNSQGQIIFADTAAETFFNKKSGALAGQTLMTLLAVGDHHRPLTVRGPASPPRVHRRHGDHAHRRQRQLAARGSRGTLVGPGSAAADPQRDRTLAHGWHPAGIGVDLEVVARKTVRAIRQGRHEVVITASGKLLVWASRLFPRVMDAALARRK